MNISDLFGAIICSILCIGCGTQEGKAYEKQVKFDINTELEQKVNLASLVVPTPNQLERQKIELAALLSFGLNTFTGDEWGSGDDNLQLFNPTDFDADQWIKTLKESGFELAILTAKHHDGFCLWPTRTTNYSVASTPWLSGRGDVVKEVQLACEKYGMKFGIYISSWDRNASSYGSSYFNTFFKDQLQELLTNYGDIYEVWIDNISNVDADKPQHQYDWKDILKLIKDLQPNALTAVVGDDIRWIGNEKGISRESEWSVTAFQPNHLSENNNKALNLKHSSSDLGSTKLVEKADALYWYPAEMDISIRPSWFYKAHQDNQVKSLYELINLYYQSIGNNSMLLLNVPPTKEGLISKVDSIRLNEFWDFIQLFKNDNLVVNADSLRQLKSGESAEYQLHEFTPINTILLQEDIAHGQQVESFTIEAKMNAEWQPVYKGTTIGYKRIVQLPVECYTQELKVTIDKARGTALINNFGAYNIEMPMQPQTTRPLNELSSYRWRMVSPHEESESIIDNNITTFWFGKDDIIVNLRREECFSGIIYTPVAGLDNAIYRYSFQISDDGENWTTVLDQKEFGNMVNNPIQQWQLFEEKVCAKYIKLIVHQATDLTGFYSIADLGLIK